MFECKIGLKFIAVHWNLPDKYGSISARDRARQLLAKVKEHAPDAYCIKASKVGNRETLR